MTAEDLGVGARGGCLSWPTESRCCHRRAKERGKGSQPCSIPDPVSQKPTIEGKRPVSLESWEGESSAQRLMMEGLFSLEWGSQG